MGKDSKWWEVIGSGEEGQEVEERDRDRRIGRGGKKLGEFRRGGE